MEQNKEPRYGPSTLWSTNLRQSKEEHPWKKDSLFHKCCWELDSHMQKNKIRPLFYTRHKNKLKMDERAKCETQESTKILEENTGSNLFDLSHSHFFLDMSPQARETKAKLNHWDFIKIKFFCTAKETVNKTKRQLTEQEKISANVLQIKG